MKEVVELVDNQIAERSAYLTKSAEAASSSSASPSPSASVDPLDELEEDDAEATPSASATPEIEEVPEIYTAEDRTKIEDVTEKARKWLEETRSKQDKLSANEDPILTVEELKVYKQQLDDVVMEMMMKKMKHFKPPKPKSTPKPKSKKPKTKKTKTASSEKPSETPVAPKDAEADTEQLDPQAQAEQQREEIKSGGPKVESHGGSGPTEDELREALKKAGVEWNEEQINEYVSKDKHDEL